MANDTAKLVVGDRIGTYRVVGHLVGNTYRAVHLDTPQRVLIEVAPLEGWRDSAVQMMRAERLVESLQHPGVARIVARDVLADRRPWIATEVPSGLGLYDLIARRPMPAGEATALIRDLAEVLAYAHERGVVHRALTLRSIVLATGERSCQSRRSAQVRPPPYPVVIADWGLRIDDLGVYGAPELGDGNSAGVLAGRADGRVDVYSLGVIAFRAVTRTFPSALGVDDVPGVPAGLATLIARMLAKLAAERPTSAEVRALADELLATSEGDAVAEAIATADGAANATPELMMFGDDTAPNRDDVVHQGGPRFNKPKWTPAPELAITSERGPFAAGEIDPKPTKPQA